jgi:hypothetical protein
VRSYSLMIPYHPIFVGSACHNQCLDCPTGDEERYIALNALIEVLNQLPDCRNIVLVGGEPLVHKDVLSLITAARKRGAIRIKVVTNGRELADWNLLERLLEKGCRIFEIKIFGSSPAVHDTMTGKRGSFEEAVQGMANLEAASRSEDFADAVFVTARIEIGRINLQDLAAAMGLAASFGVDRIVFARRWTDFPLAEGARIVSNVMRTATLNRIWTMSEGFPPCLMKGSERHLLELIRPTLHNGEKPAACRTCVCRDVCSGPPKDYIRLHGSEEFKPVPDAPYVETVQRIAQGFHPSKPS